MQPFAYHIGQRTVQREANSVPCADKLSTWVGPVVDFANGADIIVLAHAGTDDGNHPLRVVALSGPAPLVQARGEEGAITLGLPLAVLEHLPVNEMCGGIVINPATARRSRIAGIARQHDEGVGISCDVAFTNCRKYMTPTSSEGTATHIGPTGAITLLLSDAWVRDMIDAGETAFLVTSTPTGVGDVSHRGGPPGFLRFDPAKNVLTWTEYLGDGMFVSTGNLRQNANCALIILDFTSGDALRLDGTAAYTNIRADRKARVDALLQASEPFPMQGRIQCHVRNAQRLAQFCWPRTRVATRQRITSEDETAVQHP